jgi:hypothetical protein
MTNPANFASGLLDERASAVRAGDDVLVADIDAQLAAARAELKSFDTTSMDSDQSAFVAEVRRRMAAADGGDFGVDGPPQGPASLHNPANYVAGLLDEREGAVRAGREDAVAEIDAELAKAGPMLEKFGVSGMDEDQAAVVAGIRRRHEAFKRGGKKADEAPKKVTETAPDKRTAKAEPPPRTASK